jgi:sialate O-acetylesterase
MKLFLSILLLVCVLPIASAQDQSLSLASLFANDMVIQRETVAPVWGHGIPGRTVRVSGSWGASASAVVATDSSWRVRLKTPKAGGPFTISAGDGASTLKLTNVLSGDVWLCSGQSNMEMQLAGWPPNDTIMTSAEEIAHAANPLLRIYTVKRVFSASPEAACQGEWSEASPKSAPEVSATAWFFARKLQRDVRIPIGIVVSSWGGTVVDAWTSAKALAALPGYDTTLHKVAAAQGEIRKYREWLAQFPKFSVTARPEGERWHNLSFHDDACAERAYPDSAWRMMTLPTGWEATEVGDFDGVVWFRKSVKIPDAWRHHDLTLALGPIDDLDVTYINGVRVGGNESNNAWNVDRVYTVPAALVDSTMLQISIRVVDLQGGGGVYGPKGCMTLRTAGSPDAVDLSGPWRYMPVAYFGDGEFVVFGPTGDNFFHRPAMSVSYGPNMATALYNGMIAPLVPMALTGVIWYQGESDIYRSEQYRKLFTTMIENWRRDFDRPKLPFYYVQIAPYQYGGTNDGSAYLREAQLQTLAVPYTGMAVTLDIGNFLNIHPANKRDVGERLALAALANTYGKKVGYTGPVYTSMAKRKSVLELRFAHAEGGLVLTGAMRGNGFMIAGADRVFRQARVVVDGKKLLVSHPDIADPVAVRYAWTDTPEATLFGVNGLPASSFRTDDGKK